jgi:hypothetical protein
LESSYKKRLCSEQVRQDSEQEGWSFSSRDWKAAIKSGCAVGYNEFDFFLENKEYRPFHGCKIEI